MVIHEKAHDLPGAGKWDISTTRYVPVGGGSRSRLPIADDPEYPRYRGYVGIDEYLTPDIYRIAHLYAFLGGRPIIPEGEEGKFTALILEQTVGRLTADLESEGAEP